MPIFQLREGQPPRIAVVQNLQTLVQYLAQRHTLKIGQTPKIGRAQKETMKPIYTIAQDRAAEDPTQKIRRGIRH